MKDLKRPYKALKDLIRLLLCFLHWGSAELGQAEAWTPKWWIYEMLWACAWLSCLEDDVLHVRARTIQKMIKLIGIFNPFFTKSVFLSHKTVFFPSGSTENGRFGSPETLFQCRKNTIFASLLYLISWLCCSFDVCCTHALEHTVQLRQVLDACLCSRFHAPKVLALVSWKSMVQSGGPMRYPT